MTVSRSDHSSGSQQISEVVFGKERIYRGLGCKRKSDDAHKDEEGHRPGQMLAWTANEEAKVGCISGANLFTEKQEAQVPCCSQKPLGDSSNRNSIERKISLESTLKKMKDSKDEIEAKAKEIVQKRRRL